MIMLLINSFNRSQSEEGEELKDDSQKMGVKLISPMVARLHRRAQLARKVIN